MGITEEKQTEEAPNTDETDDRKAVPSIEELQRQVESLSKAVKDTQSAYTKSRQQIKALELENKLIKEGRFNLPDERKQELEQLKYENPEKWRQEINKLEAQWQKQIKDEVSKASLEEARKAKIELLQTRYPHITEDVLLNDVPPRLVKKLQAADGDDFEKVIKKIDEYLGKGKVISPSNPDTLGQPNLNKIAGGSKPDQQKANEDLSNKWTKITF